MIECFSPGFKLVIEESMFFEWKGRGGYDIRGLQQVSKVIHKPKGVGLDVKNSLCCLWGVMLHYEMLEGKAAMANKEYCCPGINATTATMMQLVKPWMYKGRHIVGNSWFACIGMGATLLA